MRKTSHNRSPKPAHASDDKETGRKPSIKRQTTGYRKETFALDKTALVWFQTNRSKFKDLTMLKMMFLQRYNPWGKTKREQLQSWNILSFNPKTTDVDEHIDLINTLGDCKVLLLAIWWRCLVGSPLVFLLSVFNFWGML